MFGYVRACRSEMKYREYDVYRAAYCGVCRAMKETTGSLSRLTLSYDMAFLALCRAVLSKEPIRYERRRCIAHPFRPHPVMVSDGDLLPYCAGVSGILSYHKAEDDLADGSRAKKLGIKLILPFFTTIRKRARMPLLDEEIRKKLDELSLLERAGSDSIDAAASVFGDLLGKIFSDGYFDERTRIAYELGYHTGRFIYIADAADDYEKDKKSENYNPIRAVYGDDFGVEQKKDILTALRYELTLAERALDLTDFTGYEDIAGILYNILRFGMPIVMRKALGIGQAGETVGEQPTKKEA